MIDTLRYYCRNRTDLEYVYVDSIENPIDSLESILFFFKKKDNLKWKWIIFALHHSLYHFGIASLEKGNYENVLTDKYDPDKDIYIKQGNEKWKKSKIIKSINKPLYKIEWVKIDGEPIVNGKKPEIKKRLLGFLSVIARIQDSEFYMDKFMSNAIILSDDEEKSIVKLVHLRNNFMHFTPKNWGIEIEYCKQVLFNIINIIERLVLKSHTIFIKDEKDIDRIENIISEIKSQI